jgi:hypothetical protein
VLDCFMDIRAVGSSAIDSLPVFVFAMLLCLSSEIYAARSMKSNGTTEIRFVRAWK